jgi:hypothetical protein
MALDWVKDYVQFLLTVGIPLITAFVLFYCLVVTININPLLGWPTVIVIAGGVGYPMYHILRKRERTRAEEVLEGEDNKKFLSPEETQKIIEGLYPKEKED